MSRREWLYLALAVGLLALVGYNVAGILGLTGTHEHADLEVYLNSTEPYDLSAERYQLAAREVHLEEGDADAEGATIHIHEDGLVLADFFASIGWEVGPEAITTDTGDTHAVDAENTLEILVDGQAAEDGFQAPLEEGASFVVRYTHAQGDS